MKMGKKYKKVKKKMERGRIGQDTRGEDEKWNERRQGEGQDKRGKRGWGRTRIKYIYERQERRETGERQDKKEEDEKGEGNREGDG